MRVFEIKSISACTFFGTKSKLIMNSENCHSQGAAYRTFSQSGGMRKTPRSILIGFRSLSHSGQIEKTAKSQSESIYRANRCILRFLNPIPHGGGAIMAPPTMNPSAISTGSGLRSPKLMTLFLSRIERSQRSHFLNFF